MAHKTGNDLLLGAHTSTQGGLQNALIEGKEIGATTIQFFTSNQKQWKGRIITNEICDAWQSALKETGISHTMSHDSYLINLGSPKEEGLIKSRQAFIDEIERCNQLNVSYLNFHPGAALDGTVEECLDRIVESLLLVEPHMKSSNTKLLLETTAGQGTSVGHRFEQIGYIVDRVKHKIPIGVCIDTCHIFAAGYDIRTPKAWQETLAAFDQLIGLTFLYAFHLNDSLKDLGSRVDRHADLGQGKIGWEAFRYLMNCPSTKHLPKYLETPGLNPVWKEDILKLRQFAA